LDLLRTGARPTPDSTRAIIASNREWAPKLKRAIFSDANIAQALRELESLFPGAYSAAHK
jgi:hypothetical protein